MNLLTDRWIPVRPVPAGGGEKISFGRLLCEEEAWELSLPRDDMELAALQMLICMAQVMFMPRNTGELKQRILKPLLKNEFEKGYQPFRDWFQVDSPKFPFMQSRRVKASEDTPLDKLLPGVTGATNSCFVNEPGLGGMLCAGCAAIALFNQAANAPSFGGGFKGSLRGGAPVTTLIQGDHLRQTIWLNVLTREAVESQLPWYDETADQKPTWVAPIKAGQKIPAQKIGLLRGLFWQPAAIELSRADGKCKCTCCGWDEQEVYQGFLKAKFSFTVEGSWPHPHGARVVSVNKGAAEEKFVSFTTEAPAWTHLGRFVLLLDFEGKKKGQIPAAVVRQAKGLIRNLRLAVGGYRHKQASILERRHELIFIHDGWSSKPGIVQELIDLAAGYRDALINKALFVYSKGFKDAKGEKIKGAGVSIHEKAKEQFYRRSEDAVHDALATIDFAVPEKAMAAMSDKLRSIVIGLFDESIRPYRNDPELIRTAAVARRSLYKHLNALKPQQKERGQDGSNG